MVMEIKPLPGQPGVFRSLEGHSWTTTFAGPMYGAPFGNKRRRALGAIALPSDYVAKPRPDLITQGDIASDQVPGVAFTAYIPVKDDQAVPQSTLDSVFRTIFAQQGYDVSGSSLDVDPIAYEWKYDATTKSWEAFVVAGPKDFVKRYVPGFVSQITPTAKDLEKAPKAVETYKLLLRPKDLTLSTVKVEAMLSAARSAARNWGSTVISIDVRGVQPPVEAPKPLVASIAPWIGLIGVGWIATLAARGKINR